jgi:hypothetical protein
MTLLTFNIIIKKNSRRTDYFRRFYFDSVEESQFFSSSTSQYEKKAERIKATLRSDRRAIYDLFRYIKSSSTRALVEITTSE